MITKELILDEPKDTISDIEFSNYNNNLLVSSWDKVRLNIN